MVVAFAVLMKEILVDVVDECVPTGTSWNAVTIERQHHRPH